MDDPQSDVAPDPSRAVTRSHVFDYAAACADLRAFGASGRRSEADDIAEDARRAAELERAIAAVSLPAVKR
jgi:hypothetical protein